MTVQYQHLVIAALILGSPFAQAASETRDLTDFDSIEVGGGVNLVLQQGNEFHVEVSADEGDPGEIITEVRNGTLIIRRDFPDSWRGWRARDWDRNFSATVTLPVLESLEASGGSGVESSGTFTGDRLRLRASGGSDVTLAVEVDTLRVHASGGSDLELSGSANRLRAESSGGSDLDASRLTAKEADVRSSGGSDARISVTESIIADASGGSDIYYSGDPQYEDIDTSGSGDVRHR